jgi:TusA-related sulfurtransferase
MEKVHADARLSTEDLDCGWIAVRASEVMDELRPGQVLEIACETREKEEDVELWIEMTGHELVNLERRGEWSYFYVKKKPY